MIIAIIVVVIVVLLALYIVLTYNRLVRTRNQIDNAYSQIDVQLKRRYDLIPNLVETVKGYAAHEKSTFEAVTNARANAIQAQQGGSPAQQAQAENVLSGALKSLFAVAEAYPDLKANQNFLNLQEELTSTEDRIAYARQFYNDSVLGYNNRIQSFPGNIIAGSLQASRRASTSKATRRRQARSRSSSRTRGSVGHCHGHVRADRAQQTPHVRDAGGLRAADRARRGRARHPVPGRHRDRPDRHRHRDRARVDLVLLLGQGRARREPGASRPTVPSTGATTTSSRA